MNIRYKIFFLILIAFFSLSLFFHKYISAFSSSGTSNGSNIMNVRSIDTMKISRDRTRAGLDNPDFDSRIDRELQGINSLGANFVAINTAYDKELFSYLERWVEAARHNNLKVWFRGNWSGWEGWFNYPKKMTREEHLNATRNFIISHPDLFQDGDIFTACPECEYGGPGSPLSTGDIEGYRKFMIDEHNMMKSSFAQIGKDVKVNYTSMNPDVAKLILDKPTVEALGNIIVLDYYVKDVKSLEKGLNFFKERFPNTKIVLGELGAPIPDINGLMTDEEQAKFIDELLSFLQSRDEIIGINYWVSTGGTTAIFDQKLNPKPAADIVKKYFTPGILKGTVVDNKAKGLSDIPIFIDKEDILVKTDRYGNYSIELVEGKYHILLGGSSNYVTVYETVDVKSGESKDLDIILKQKNVGFIEKFLRFLRVSLQKKQPTDISPLESSMPTYLDIFNIV